jgi:hypothetical protein
MTSPKWDWFFYYPLVTRMITYQYNAFAWFGTILSDNVLKMVLALDDACSFLVGFAFRIPKQWATQNYSFWHNFGGQSKTLSLCCNLRFYVHFSSIFSALVFRLRIGPKPGLIFKFKIATKDLIFLMKKLHPKLNALNSIYNSIYVWN